MMITRYSVLSIQCSAWALLLLLNSPNVTRAKLMDSSGASAQTTNAAGSRIRFYKVRYVFYPVRPVFVVVAGTSVVTSPQSLGSTYQERMFGHAKEHGELWPSPRNAHSQVQKRLKKQLTLTTSDSELPWT